MLRLVIGTLALTFVSTVLVGCTPNPVTHQSSMAAFFNGVGQSGGHVFAGIGAAMDNSDGISQPQQTSTSAPVQLMAPPAIVTAPPSPQIVTTNCRTFGSQTQCTSMP
jgi:hypothetical protein